MAFKKIQNEQINLVGFGVENRLSIFMTDVTNTDSSNTIQLNRYDAIGSIDPVQSFSTDQISVDIVLQWEGPSDVFDGVLSINDNIIYTTNPNAVFEAIPNSRRFQCTYTIDITSMSNINFSILNREGNKISTNSVSIIPYISASITTFNFLYGVLSDGDTNSDGSYPLNSYLRYDVGTSSFTLVDIEQTYLKEGDFVKIRATFDEFIEIVRIYDHYNIFTNSDYIDIDLSIPNNEIEEYIEVINTGTVSNAYVSMQVYNGVNWSSLKASNASGSVNMFNVININNDLPSGTTTVSIPNGQTALDNNDTATINYSIGGDDIWNIQNISILNPYFNFNMVTEDVSAEITLKATISDYDLTKEYIMTIANTLNGKETDITSIIPIASEDFTVSFNSINLTSSATGNLNTIIATFDQNIDTTKTIIVNGVTTPDSGISLSNYRYDGDNVIKIDTIILDNHLTGDLTFTLDNVYGLSGRILDFTTTYTVRGFEQRTIIATNVGDNRISLDVEIEDELYFNAVLLNNGSAMNYKEWDGGSVLTSNAMTKNTGLTSSDQYAYTFDPVNKEIVLSSYIITYLLDNKAQISISKN